MPTKYLLPCKCGRKHVVEPVQAGEQLLCHCGDTLPVPTLLDMRKLEPLRTPMSPSSTISWGGTQRTLVAGIVICLVGAALLVFFWARRPEPPDDATKRRFVERVVQSSPPAELIRIFETLRKEGLQPGRDKDIRNFFELRRRYTFAMVGSAVVALAGIVVIVCALSMSAKVRAK